VAKAGGYDKGWFVELGDLRRFREASFNAHGIWCDSPEHNGAVIVVDDDSALDGVWRELCDDMEEPRRIHAVVAAWFIDDTYVYRSGELAEILGIVHNARRSTNYCGSPELTIHLQDAKLRLIQPELDAIALALWF